MTILNKVNLIMKVTGTLSDFTAKINPGDLEREMWSHVNSKYSNEFNIQILNEPTHHDGIACLVNSGEQTSITFFNLNKKKYRIPSLKNIYKKTETFEIGPNDLIMFPSNIEYEIKGDGQKIMIFKVDERKGFGVGPNSYRVEVTFSDTYYINVNAKDEEEAKNIAYDINTSYWVHEWPQDKELERTQITRVSKWGKKNLRAYKVE